MGDGTPEELLALVEKWHREDATALREAFVAGATWQAGQYCWGYSTWSQQLAEEEALRRWPDVEVGGD